MIEINSMEEYENNIKEGIVVSKYWAPWCSPCKTLDPILTKVGLNHPEIKFIKIEVDNQPEIAEKYEVSSLPTMIIYKNGEKTGKIVGTITEKKLTDYLNSI